VAARPPPGGQTGTSHAAAPSLVRALRDVPGPSCSLPGQACPNSGEGFLLLADQGSQLLAVLTKPSSGTLSSLRSRTFPTGAQHAVKYN
jgi:hypothetical protein